MTVEPLNPSNGRHTCTQLSVIDDHSDRLVTLELDRSVLRREVADIKELLGKAPDLTRGTGGVGVLGVLHQIANAVLVERVRPLSMPDLDESEDTQVQNRSDLIQRARAAEVEAARKHRLAVIAAVSGLLVALGSAVAAVLGSMK